MLEFEARNFEELESEARERAHEDHAGYLQALESNLIRCEEAEEYELCKDAISWIKKLRK